MLIPRSLVFVAPEEAVTTFEVQHPDSLGRGSEGGAPPDTPIIKGSPSRYALEKGASLQMGTLAYYRKHGDSLIWDMQEGVIAGDERTGTRRDDPTDLDGLHQTDIEESARHPLEQALGPKTTERLDVSETSQDSLVVGNNCIIWCASLQPQTAKEWSLWWDSLEPDYDHSTFLGQPAPFARALAAMASSERDLLGSYLDIRHPETGHVEQCNNLAVFYGPVVYLEDPRDYILAPGNEVEQMVRCIFTKTAEHRHQREYRFAILSRQDLDPETLCLQVPPSLREALNASSRARGLHLPEDGPALYVPSPRLRRCFAGEASRASPYHRHWSSLAASLRVRLHISGTHHKSSTKRQVAVSQVSTVDDQAIEAAIRAEPPVPNDSRIAKLTIDGGPGTVTHIYCLEGIWGTIRLKAAPGRVNVGIRGSDPYTAHILFDTSGFDGEFKLSHTDQQLILTVIPMNPAATVDIDHPHRNPDLPKNHITLSRTQDTHVTVTATSQDRTQVSSLEIVFDRAWLRLSQDAPRALKSARSSGSETEE